ncbi:decarboxylase [Candidatus Woesearchaeota archaeon]|nr:decarboxylase [Candidatus Woesearchaeota archaeon]
MAQAKFILSKKVLKEQIKTLENLKFKISYSYKTNKTVGRVIQSFKELDNIDFSIHAEQEIKDIKNKSRIWFFLQAQSKNKIEQLLKKGIKKYVIDNEIDLSNLLEVIKNKKSKIELLLRMKFEEHRIGTGKYFVYGLPSNKILEIIKKISKNKYIEKLGIHIHRKSQNLTEWEILEEIKDSLPEEILEEIKMVNLGGGLPSRYISMNKEVFGYIFSKLKEVKDWLDKKGIETIIEPGRFISAPCIKLETRIIQIQDNNIIINTSLYNCALDNLLTGTKMLVEQELKEEEDGKFFLIKGNSPTRDDIFRYRVKLKKNIKIGDKITFLNAGAYNYATDFFGYKKLKTEIKEDF